MFGRSKDSCYLDALGSGWVDNVFSSDGTITGYYNSFLWKDATSPDSQSQKISCTIGFSKSEVTKELEECSEYEARTADDPTDEPLGNTPARPPPNKNTGGFSSHGGPP